MHRPVHVLIYALACSSLVSCAHRGAIFRETDLHSGRSVILDAKQRLITNMNVEEDTFYGRIRPKRIVCAEPSPDVAEAVSRALSSALEASLQRPDGTDISAGANGTFAAATSLAQLGERIATIQLLRDELSDLCRSYANGAVSTTTYTLRLSKLDTKMVTLLMGEMAAGAFGRPLGAVSGHASVSGGSSVEPEEWNRANDRLARADADVRRHSEHLEQAAPEQRAHARRKLEQAVVELHQASEHIAALARSSANSANSAAGGDASGLAGYVGSASGATDRAVGRQLVQLQRQFLDHDELSTLVDACVTALDLRERKSGDSEQREVELLRDSRETANRHIAELERKRSALIRQRSDREIDLGVLTEQRSTLAGRLAALEAQEIPEEAAPGLREAAEEELERLRKQISRVSGSLAVERASRLEIQSALDAVQQDIDAKRNDMLFEPTRTRSDLGVYCTEHMDDIRGMVADQRREVTELRRLEIEARQAAARLDFCKSVLTNAGEALPSGVQRFCSDPESFLR